MLTLVTAMLVVSRIGPDPVPAAMIVRLQGPTEIEPLGGPPRRAAVMDLLYAGDRVRVAEGGDVVLVFFTDKHGERLKAGAGAHVGRDSCTPAEAVERLARAQAFAAVPFQDVRPLRVNGRGAGVVFR